MCCSTIGLETKPPHSSAMDVKQFGVWRQTWHMSEYTRVLYCLTITSWYCTTLYSTWFSPVVITPAVFFCVLLVLHMCGNQIICYMTWLAIAPLGNPGERFASHDDIFDCRGSKRSGRLYFCSGPYLILPTIEWQIQHLCQHDLMFIISRYRACACTHNLMTRVYVNIYLALICFLIRPSFPKLG